MRKSLFFSIYLAIAGLLLSACSNTSLVNSWSDPSYADKPLQNIVVFSKNQDPLISRSVQQQVTDTLGHVINVTPAYKVFPDGTDITDMPLPKLLGVLAQKGYDGLLMTGLTNITKTENYTPPTVIGLGGSNWDGWSGWNSFGIGGWGTATVLPGYNTTTKNYFVQGSLYSTQNDQLVWSAQTETSNPTDAKSTIADIVRLFNSNLLKSKVLEQKAK